ncbi:hypothetical protein LAZ67_2004229 [Cordylochernes scorpioides]|uniref:Mos1 transposase HTH domain-containing protein n=1 Tax=Cordylochernes scorpioides TaxID=51811 RepID=A0ABY6K3W0_9ARAC|nr:hypothetical protein LAZ67_2004229 [Cordylochernes scorpioides]
MERSLEQRYAIKFCVRLGKNATETFQMLQKAFKDDCISRSQSGKWHKAFKEGREEVADEPRSGRPTTARTDENVDRVLEVLRIDRRLSIQQIADTLHMSTFVVHGIVTEDLQMRKGETVNSAFYLEVLRRLKRRIARVRTDIKDTVKLHHDNVTSHTAFIITNFLARSNTLVIPHPPYSPDLAPSYGDAVMSRRRVFEWYKCFEEGREETADNERSGRPSTSTTPEKVDKVLKLVLEDRRITVREVAEEAGISFGSTQSIMKDVLGVRRLKAFLVPKDLTFDQKNARKETASLNLEATTDDPELLKRVITGDEIWIYGFDSETTQQASEWRFKNEPRPKKARKAPSKVKVMLTVFFDYQGIVHNEFQHQALQ